MKCTEIGRPQEVRDHSVDMERDGVVRGEDLALKLGEQRRIGGFFELGLKLGAYVHEPPSACFWDLFETVKENGSLGRG